MYSIFYQEDFMNTNAKIRYLDIAELAAGRHIIKFYVPRRFNSVHIPWYLFELKKINDPPLAIGEKYSLDEKALPSLLFGQIDNQILRGRTQRILG